MDLSTAFDNMPHGFLTAELFAYGAANNAYNYYQLLVQSMSNN